MDGIGAQNSKLFIMAATNLPWSIDTAILRRFDKKVYIPLPDPVAREYLVRKKLEVLGEALTNEDFQQIALKTENFSGSDLEQLCTDVAMQPLY